MHSEPRALSPLITDDEVSRQVRDLVLQCLHAINLDLVTAKGDLAEGCALVAATVDVDRNVVEKFEEIDSGENCTDERLQSQFCEGKELGDRRDEAGIEVGEEESKIFERLGSAAGIGSFLIAFGPVLTIFFLSIVPKPFLILTTLAGALIWLVSLVAAAIIWRAFLPYPSWMFLIMLITAVYIQEVTRIFYWRFFLKTKKYLDVLAVKLSKPQVNFVDSLEVSLASGVGHGVAHALYFGLSVVAPAFGPATYYTETCKQMPFFLVSALLTLAFFLLHTFSMVITFNAYTYGIRTQKLFVPLMHLGASFLTLLNLLPNGCTVCIPLVFLCTLVTMAYSGSIVWQNLNPNFLNHNSFQSVQLGSLL